MHSRLRGRAEAVRSTIVYLAEASSPPLSGWLSGLLGGGQGGASGPAGGEASAGNLDPTFIVMVAVLLAAGIILLIGAKTYPCDVATAAASEEATRNARQCEPAR